MLVRFVIPKIHPSYFEHTNRIPWKIFKREEVWTNDTNWHYPMDVFLVLIFDSICIPIPLASVFFCNYLLFPYVKYPLWSWFTSLVYLVHFRLCFHCRPLFHHHWSQIPSKDTKYDSSETCDKLKLGRKLGLKATNKILSQNYYLTEQQLDE